MFRSVNSLAVLALILVVFGLGVWGYSLCPAGLPLPCTLPDWQERTLNALKLFLKAGAEYPSPNPPWQLMVARYVAPYVIPIVAVFATVKVALANMRRDVRVMLARSKRRHFIVCGLGETGMQIVQNLGEAGESVVVVDRILDQANAAVVERDGVPVLKGDAVKPAVLRQAGLPRASVVVLCTGQDTVNADIALRIRESSARWRRTEPLTVLMELRDEWLFRKLIEHDREALGTERVEVRPFNVYENAARLLVRSLRPQAAADGAARPFLIFGFGRMGRETAVQVIRAAPVPLGERTQVVVFDRDVDAGARKFHNSWPGLANVADVELVDVDLEADVAASWKAIDKRLKAATPLAVAVCLPDDHESLHVALEVRGRLDKLGQTGTPLFVRLQRHQRLGAFAAQISRIEPHEDRLWAFGALEDLLTPDILVASRLDRLAEACHRHYLDSLGKDHSDSPNSRPWRALPEQFRISNRRQADHIGIKLAQAGLRMQPSDQPQRLNFTPAETELLAKLEHRRWLIERRLLGWTYGKKRDDQKLVNPNLLEWEQLPEPVRTYNREAVSALPQILAAAGFEIQRKAQ